MLMKTVEDKINFGITLLLTGVFLGYGFLSKSTYFHDDIMHFMISKYSWQHPALFFDSWGRPAFTLLYAPAAIFGFSAARAFSAIIAGFTCYLGGYLAKLYGVKWFWLGTLFIGMQFEFFKQGFSLLTELTFAFLFCLALIFYKKQNWLLMAICSSLLPLARYESLAISLLFILVLLQQKQYRAIFLIPIPLLMQNVFNAFLSHQLSTIIFPLDKLLGLNAGGYTEFQYNPSSPFFFFWIAPIAFNFVIFFFCCYGAIFERFGVLQLSIIVTICTLNITNWLFPGAAVAEYPRFLAQLAPAVGILATIGLEKFLDSHHLRSKWYWATGLFLIYIPWILSVDRKTNALLFLLPIALIIPIRSPQYRKTISGLTIISLIVVLTYLNIKPFPVSQENTMVENAVGWFRSSPYTNSKVYGSHIYFDYLANIDIFDMDQYGKLTPAAISSALKGDILIWDSHYSNRLTYQVPLESVENDANFTLIKSFKDGKYSMKFFIVN